MEEAFRRSVNRANPHAAIPVYIGRRDKDLPMKPLDSKEDSALRTALQDIAEWWKDRNVLLGRTFERQIDHMVDMVRSFKYNTGKEVSDDPLVPGSDEIGIQEIIPEVFNMTKFEIPADSEDTEFYFWGGPTDSDYFKTNDPNVGTGYAIYVCHGGIVSYGAQPIARQMQFRSDETTLPPFTASGLTQRTVDEESTIYQYKTLGGHILRWDIGTWMKGLRERTHSDPIPYDLLGIFCYVKEYYEGFLTV